MSKLLNAALIFVSMFVPFAASADMLPNDAHIVSRTIQIENVSDFSAYDFVLATEFKFPGSEKVTSEAPVSVYGGTVRLFAIKKADWSAVKRDESDPETAGGWYNLKENAPLLLWSELNLSLGQAYLPDTDPTVSERHVIRIDGVGGGTVSAHLVRTERQTAKGEYSITPGTPPSTPTPSAQPTATVPTTAAQQPTESLPNSVVIPVLAGLLGLALGYAARKTWKK